MLATAARRPAAPETFGRATRLARAVLGGLVVGALAVTAKRADAFARTVSGRSVASSELAAAWQRLSLLVLGYGGPGHDGPYITDSMLVLSAGPGGPAAQITVPRDLWCEIPPGSARCRKLNTVYSLGRVRGGPAAGGELAAGEVSRVLGMPIPFWLTIDFRGFRALIDALGGVEVDVERGFSSRYPAEGSSRADPGWIRVAFRPGRQRLSGEEAIRYARARYADEPREASDFARGRRQQKLVTALVARLTHPAAWGGLPSVARTLEHRIRTNLPLLDLVYLTLRLRAREPRRIALSTDNVLVDATSANGLKILLPRGGDWAVIPRYVRQQMQG